jgi:hypothetical protein
LREVFDWSIAERHLGALDERSEWPVIAGQVLVDQLKAGENEAGSRAVEPAADESRDHLGEGALDGGAVCEIGQVEGGQSWLPPGCARAARGVVVVTELLVAEGGRAAGLAGRLKVTAGGTGCRHGEAP